MKAQKAILKDVSRTPASDQWRLEMIRASRRKHEDKFVQVWNRSGFVALERGKAARIFPNDRREFDFVHKAAMVAIEIQGGVWMKKSGHNTGAGISRDIRKAFDASVMGWVVLQVLPEMIGFVTVGKIHDLILKRQGKGRMSSMLFQTEDYDEIL